MEAQKREQLLLLQNKWYISWSLKVEWELEWIERDISILTALEARKKRHRELKIHGMLGWHREIFLLQLIHRMDKWIWDWGEKAELVAEKIGYAHTKKIQQYQEKKIGFFFLEFTGNHWWFLREEWYETSASHMAE